ncbi:MAG: hypothetical protein QXJ06_01750, partial [Candidatus Aenigmatarchaeota archaeon]
PSISEAVSRMPETAKKDRLEWNTSESLYKIWHTLLTSELDPKMFELDPKICITDDNPVNEYYLMREKIIPSIRDTRFFRNQHNKH